MNRATLWQQIETKRDSFEASQTKKMKDALQDSIQPILDDLHSFGPKNALATPMLNEAAIKDAYKDLYVTVGTSFARSQYNALQEKSYKAEDDLPDIWQQRLETFVETEALGRIADLNSNTLDKIRDVIRKGIQNGDGVDTIANAMRDSSAVSKARARVIVRTETVAASSEGTQVGAESSRLDLNKVWISTQDGRTRTFAQDGWGHYSADGETVGMNEDFTETGEPLKYPGDPNGSAGNVIQCRCALAHIKADEV